MIRIAVLCPSEIAYRRFMPSLKEIKTAVFCGIGHASEEEWFGSISPEHDLSILEADKQKAEKFVNEYGGVIFDSFKDVITSKDVDAVYIPLPPALHFKWAKLALENGKHVLVEKPSTTSLKQTEELVNLAAKNKLALHENYMFNFHSQLDVIEELIKSNAVGDVRLIRISFGFPFRGANDFRYSKKMGGGALLDCGGYTIKLACRFLGKTARLIAHNLNYKEEFEVDIYGSGMLINDDGLVAQISFGMDNSYKCDLEIWGSEGSLFTGRVLTAPSGYQPTIKITTKDSTKDILLDSDDSFKKSINHFLLCIQNKNTRLETYEGLKQQASFVDMFKQNSKE